MRGKDCPSNWRTTRHWAGHYTPLRPRRRQCSPELPDDKSAAETGAAQIAALGRHCCVIQGHISKPEEVRRLVATAERDLGPIDVLVNNAGIFPRMPFLELTEETWDAVLNTNLKGTFVCAQEVTRRRPTHSCQWR